MGSRRLAATVKAVASQAEVQNAINAGFLELELVGDILVSSSPITLDGKTVAFTTSTNAAFRGVGAVRLFVIEGGSQVSFTNVAFKDGTNCMEVISSYVTITRGMFSNCHSIGDSSSCTSSGGWYCEFGSGGVRGFTQQIAYSS